MSDTTIRELDWYLRDHLFRQSNAGKTSFRKESLPGEMATIYLRYKNADFQQLSQIMIPVLEGLVAKKVLEQDGSGLKMPGRLARLQCAKMLLHQLLGRSRAEGVPPVPAQRAARFSQEESLI
jgi:hypothetical protein